MDSVALPLVSQLSNILQNPIFPAHLQSAVQAVRQSQDRKQKRASKDGGSEEDGDSQLFLRIEASLVHKETSSAQGSRLTLVNIRFSPTIPTLPDFA